MRFSAELVLGVIASASLLWLAIANSMTWVRIRRNGVVSEATVISKHRGRNASVTYRYEISREGKTTAYEQTQQVYGSTYQAIAKDSKVAIRYSPSDPHKSVLIDDAHELHNSGWSILLALTATIIILAGVR